MKGSETQKKMYSLLREYANSQAILPYDEIERVTGWSKSTFERTYYSKMYSDFMEKQANGYRVRPHFSRISRDEFLAHVTQSRKFFEKYSKIEYSRIIIYEFLLPLTKEDKLRRSLDELFFKDTLEQRYSEIAPSVLEGAIPRESGETDESYKNRVLQFISEYISGYSISTVNGRFRATELKTRQEAVKTQESEGIQYIQDETTASVQFIIPCPSSRKDINYRNTGIESDSAWEEDIRLVRTLFFEFFVEAIIKTIRGEDKIWLIETSNVRRLYVFEREPV